MSFSDFPSKGNTAPLADRYIGLYAYCGYWQHWDKIIGYKAGISGQRTFWIVQKVDLLGNPVDDIREHCTAMHADMFADRPFVPTYEQLRNLKG